MGLSIAQVVMSRKDRTVEEPSCTCRAFSRVDGLAVAFGLALLSLVVLPGLGQVSWRSERLQCLSNLRWIGRAFQVWGADHGDWQPWRTSVTTGGTQPDSFSVSKIGNTWYEMAWVSNELVTPKVLVCPSDRETTRVARDFSTRPDGGFLHANYRGNALSYFIGLDIYPYLPTAVLCGDRNLRVDDPLQGCSSRIANAAMLHTHMFPAGVGVGAWTNGVHFPAGNLLLNDGSLHETTTPRMLEVIANGDDNASYHILMPR